MYLRTCSSSKPTVDTAYPRAQRCSPVKFRSLTHKRAIAIALFPFRNPITEATGYFGGIAMHGPAAGALPESGIPSAAPTRGRFLLACGAPGQTIYQRLAHSSWDCRYHVVIGSHQAMGRMLCRNGQTSSSLTGRTSGLPKI